MPDDKAIAVWKDHLQDEIDAAYLYRVLADLVPADPRCRIYRQLGSVEDKHIAAWKDLLTKNNADGLGTGPSRRARFLAWVSQRFSPAILSTLLLREEATEVKSYLTLYNDSSDEPTKNIALRLARDSAGHANELMGALGQTGGEPWHHSETGGMLRNVVYGFNDGLTANFGLIAGMIGADVADHVVLISGIAGMIADSLSMGSSGYLAAVSEQEVFDHERRMEADEILLMPELETEELILLYEAKGMKHDDAVRMATEIMKDPQAALEEKVQSELGIGDRATSPLREGWITGAATAIGAFIPVLPFIFLDGVWAIWTSFAISMAAHFGVGAARSIFTGRGLFRSGLDMFVVGIGVAAVAYVIGELVSKLF
jgi:VIT1/CCC1 family predicted Fe2+/Mn2+ transporter